MERVDGQRLGRGGLSHLSQWHADRDRHDTSFSNTGLTPTTTYSYTVAAYDGVNNLSAQSSSRSATTLADTTAPTTPGGLAGTPVSASQINLSWSAATDSGGSGLAGYRLYRNGTQIAQTASTSASDTGLAEYTSYNYTVRSYDNAGNVSPLSSVVPVRTLDVTPPSVPGTPTAPHQPVPVRCRGRARPIPAAAPDSRATRSIATACRLARPHDELRRFDCAELGAVPLSRGGVRQRRQHVGTVERAGVPAARPDAADDADQCSGDGRVFEPGQRNVDGIHG